MPVALAGRIIELFDRDGLRFGRVQFGGVVREVCLEYQPESQTGEFVLVHVGISIATLDREVRRTWERLREIAEGPIPEDREE